MRETKQLNTFLLCTISTLDSHSRFTFCSHSNSLYTRKRWHIYLCHHECNTKMPLCVCVPTICTWMFGIHICDCMWLNPSFLLFHAYYDRCVSFIKWNKTKEEEKKLKSKCQSHSFVSSSSSTSSATISIISDWQRATTGMSKCAAKMPSKSICYRFSCCWNGW